jgi:uncharacterized membrane protein YphA (DoxX/SURF4 family)
MWNVFSWVLQGILALVFLFHGILYVAAPAKMTQPMREQGSWPPKISVRFRTFIGVAELLAAVGLILPGLLHILVFLTPLASLGLAIVMTGAIVYHVKFRELTALPVVLLLLILAGLVSIIRWWVTPL